MHVGRCVLVFRLLLHDELFDILGRFIVEIRQSRFITSGFTKLVHLYVCPQKFLSLPTFNGDPHDEVGVICVEHTDMSISTIGDIGEGICLVACDQAFPVGN